MAFSMTGLLGICKLAWGGQDRVAVKALAS